jgi:hypothetical protein
LNETTWILKNQSFVTFFSSPETSLSDVTSLSTHFKTRFFFNEVKFNLKHLKSVVFSFRPPLHLHCEREMRNRSNAPAIPTHSYTKLNTISSPFTTHYFVATSVGVLKNQYQALSLSLSKFVSTIRSEYCAFSSHLHSGSPVFP